MVEAVIVGGVSPYSYSWNTGSFNRVLNGIGAGVYTFTVTDASSQTISASVELIQPMLLEVTLIPSVYGGYNISNQGGHDGEIITEPKGGSQPYTYAWSTGATTENIYELTAGNYNLTLTDANGCTVSGSKTMTEPTPLHVVSITSPQHHGYNISCKGGNDGAINLSVTGGVPPYKYDWNTGSFDEDLSNLTAGEYSVRITDDNLAEIIASIVLTQPSGSLKVDLTPQVYANGFNLSCHDCSNGSLTAIGSAGVAPYTFLWSNGQTTTTISGLQAIGYSCIITDVNGCTSTSDKTLVAPERDDWSMTGNANTNPSVQYIGTSDNKDVVYKTNNTERLRLGSTGQITLSGDLKINSLAGTGYEPLYIDANGSVQRGIVVPQNAIACQYLRYPWKNTVTGPNDVTNCSGRVGINFDAPADFLHVRGAARFSDIALTNNYLRIGHNGTNAFVDKVGSGNLALNSILFINDNGKVGIGTSTPIYHLEIRHNDGVNIPGGIVLKNTSGTNFNSEIKFMNNIRDLWSIGIDVNHNGGDDEFFIFDNRVGERLVIDNEGKVGIGVKPPDWIPGEVQYRLYVAGGIKTQDVKVTTLNFPDYVFEENYQLMSIMELKNYLAINKHLPGIPSAKEIMEADGFQLGEMQTKILEKVEEQAIYIVSLQDQIDFLKKELMALKLDSKNSKK